MDYVGGLRARLIHDSIFYVVEAALENLGWMTDVDHLPVNFVSGTLDDADTVPFNTVGFQTASTDGDYVEVGSELTEDRYVVFFDVYAEDEDVSKHLAYDLRDILRGKFASIDRDTCMLPVLDYTLATPSFLFYVEASNVTIDRAATWTKPHQQFWRVVRAEYIDEGVYSDLPGDSLFGQGIFGQGIFGQ